MKSTLALLLVVVLHSQVANGQDPTYDELKSQLPITLTPDGGDQYFFFIVPVQKSDEPNVILQVAQAQSGSNFTNASVSATMINTHDNTVNVSQQGDNLNLDEVFKTPNSSTNKDFNFQVPVIVPLDFRFKYDPATASEVLPQCSVDTRTWKEKVISKIAEKLELPEQTWDHSSLNIRIRLRKDVLATITLAHITNTDELSSYVTTLTQTKLLSDIRYSSILSNTTELIAGHASLIAEGVDTYQMLSNSIILAEEAVTVLSGDSANQAAVDVETTRIDFIKPGTDSALELFQKALVVVKNLQELEDLEEEVNL